MSCKLPGRWSLEVHRDGVVEVRDVGALLTTLLPNNGGENWAAKCGEKKSDVGGSTGLKPAAKPGALELLINGWTIDRFVIERVVSSEEVDRLT